ncbi:hypothetical protein C6P41_000437 [Kluyveromyces marxianus]|nr:hypothetical protein C6P41_000437 [Kluyveromyces marxianus]
MLDSRTSIALVPNRNLLHNIKDESDIKLFAAGQNEIRAYPRNSGIKPLKLKHIHAFGQLAYYRINSTSKLDIRAKLGYLLHPSAESYGYIILDAETNKLVDSTDFRPFYKNGPEGITEKEFYEQVGEWLHKAQDKLNSNSQEEKNEPEFTTETHKHHTIQTQKVSKLQQKNSQPHKHPNHDSNPLQDVHSTRYIDNKHTVCGFVRHKRP